MKMDMVGNRYGRLLVVSEHCERGKLGQVRWDCLCDCGNTAVAYGDNLRRGATASCGCLRKEVTARRVKTHGQAKSKLYGVWSAMRERCNNPETSAYANYGGRGITVCLRWQSFKNFFADMGEPPEGMTLERRDNNAAYCPENCYWASRKAQANNRRSSVKVLHDGLMFSVGEVSLLLQLSVGGVWNRLRKHYLRIGNLYLPVRGRA